MTGRRMGRTAAALLGWLVAGLLAGCSSPADEAAPEATGSAVITDPRDLSYLQGNATPGSHVHDYWAGRTQATVIDEPVTDGDSYYNCSGPSCAVGFFEPPDGTVVLQGTGRIEAVATWREAAPNPAMEVVGFGNHHTRAELWVRTASDTEPKPVGPLEHGVPLVFQSTNEQDDPPHYTVSLWEFRVVFWNDGAESTSFGGSVGLKVDIFRTLPLVLFPPHADRWNGTRELVLREVEGTVEEMRTPMATMCSGGCLPSFRPDGGLVVPYDAAEVRVAFTASGATPVPVALDYHGADKRGFTTVKGQDAGGGTLLFSIPLEPGMADSPYAFQSLWEFRLHQDTPMEHGVWKGDYHVVATAYR